MRTEEMHVPGWYTATEAAMRISQNSGGRTVKPEYLRSLARLGKVQAKKIGGRTNLYLKADVDKYIVEDKGAKVARAQKARSRKTKKLKDAA